jgi:hypothetical protein
LEDGPPEFPQDFTCPVVLGNPRGGPEPFAYRTCTFCGCPFDDIRLGWAFVTPRPHRAEAPRVPRPRVHNALELTWTRFGLIPVRSPLLGESRLLSFPPGTEMVHFPGFASAPYGFGCGLPGFTWLGFPIRKSPGQSLFNGSPKLFAAGHVLRRLPAPRHPPYALKYLTIKFSQDKKCRYLRLSKNLVDISRAPAGGVELIRDRKFVVELTGIEPATSGVQNRRSPN